MALLLQHTLHSRLQSVETLRKIYWQTLIGDGHRTVVQRILATGSKLLPTTLPKEP